MFRHQDLRLSKVNPRGIFLEDMISLSSTCVSWYDTTTEDLRELAYRVQVMRTGATFALVNSLSIGACVLQTWTFYGDLGAKLPMLDMHSAIWR